MRLPGQQSTSSSSPPPPPVAAAAVATALAAGVAAACWYAAAGGAVSSSSGSSASDSTYRALLRRRGCFCGVECVRSTRSSARAPTAAAAEGKGPAAVAAGAAAAVCLSPRAERLPAPCRCCRAARVSPSVSESVLLTSMTSPPAAASLPPPAAAAAWLPPPSTAAAPALPATGHPPSAAPKVSCFAVLLCLAAASDSARLTVGLWVGLGACLALPPVLYLRLLPSPAAAAAIARCCCCRLLVVCVHVPLLPLLFLFALAAASSSSTLWSGSSRAMRATNTHEEGPTAQHTLVRTGHAHSPPHNLQDRQAGGGAVQKLLPTTDVNRKHSCGATPAAALPWHGCLCVE